ncbi:hypothetical protein ABW21_db0209575 [Orbilia brochopaga]|nr:hypothetical protein ABW21_db0209575 [Drechslerella brochopaga]
MKSSYSRKVITLSASSTPISSRASATPTGAPSSAASNPPNSEAPSPSSNAPSPPPAPSPSLSSGGGGDNGGGGDSGSGQIFSGQATFYDPGLGSCGITNSASDLIAAIGYTLFDTKATANPNNNPFCGRQIVVRPKGGFSRRSNIHVRDLDARNSTNTQGLGIAKVVTRVRPFRPRNTVAAATLESHHNATEPTL